MGTSRWSGFAALAFSHSAHIAFARAAELAETDAHEEHPEAWVIEDDRVVFSMEAAEGSRREIEGIKRFLGLLALQAIAGEAVLEIAQPPERWVCRPAMLDGEVTPIDEGDEAEGPQSKTIRVKG